jgi:sulfoxide reductase heme-binding subunit YedZ
VGERTVGRRTVHWLKVVTHVGALTPLVLLAWMFWQNQLGPVPVKAVIRLLGRYALALLLLSLVPTVVRTVTGFGTVMQMRRPLGLYAFFYASLHFLAFIGLDFGFRLGLIVTTILESRREIVGLVALGILGLLALTSIRSLMGQLGKTWKTVHRLVYAAGVLVMFHYIWNYKEWRTWPTVAGGVLAVLFIARVPAVTAFLRRWRRE